MPGGMMDVEAIIAQVVLAGEASESCYLKAWSCHELMNI
jgi:hypothetical protein